MTTTGEQPPVSEAGEYDVSCDTNEPPPPGEVVSGRRFWATVAIIVVAAILTQLYLLY